MRKYLNQKNSVLSTYDIDTICVKLLYIEQNAFIYC